MHRNHRTAVLATILLSFVLAPTAAVLADGFIVIERPIVRPTPLPPRAAYMPLEVRNHHVTCDIHDTIGVTRVEEVFYNPNAQQLEGTYLFPMPENASVQKFSMG